MKEYTVKLLTYIFREFTPATDSCPRMPLLPIVVRMLALYLSALHLKPSETWEQRTSPNRSCRQVYHFPLPPPSTWYFTSFSFPEISVTDSMVSIFTFGFTVIGLGPSEIFEVICLYPLYPLHAHSGYLSTTFEH